jgi:hypothetical protein
MAAVMKINGSSLTVTPSLKYSMSMQHSYGTTATVFLNLWALDGSEWFVPCPSFNPEKNGLPESLWRMAKPLNCCVCNGKK